MLFLPQEQYVYFIGAVTLCCMCPLNVVKLKNFIRYFTYAERHCDMLVFNCSRFLHCCIRIIYSEL